MRSFVVVLALVLSVTALAVRDDSGHDDNNSPPTNPPDTPPTCTPPTPNEVCSTCPQQDNNGHALQADLQQAAYVHCVYQDTDCFYGPRSSGTNLAFSYPTGACPSALLAQPVCATITPPAPQLLTTTCPDYNLAFIHVPLRSSPANSQYTQCHYSSSECYYDLSSGALVTGQSTADGSCPPQTVASHLQYVV
ncbi:hypothetical protein CPB86DRAFT_840613, partial [Serendipita vermifera]